MEYLYGKELWDVFKDGRRRAFHLETWDSYHTPDEDDPFQLFLDGEDDDFAWLESWLVHVRETTAAGCRFQRARVVTVPHSAYTRWGLFRVVENNVAAGEDVRYLPRHLVDAGELTADDFWLFDDDLLVFTIFEPNGRGAGGASTVDPVILRHARAVRDRVWRHAIPYHDYLKSEFVET